MVGVDSPPEADLRPFQGRFRSVLVEADEYLKPFSRYIHLNPVQTKMVNSPDEYPWSSYPAFIGKIKTPDWLETGWLLASFGRKKKEAVKNYKAYVVPERKPRSGTVLSFELKKESNLRKLEISTTKLKKHISGFSFSHYVEGIEIKALKDPEEDIIGGFILGDIDFANWVKDKG